MGFSRSVPGCFRSVPGVIQGVSRSFRERQERYKVFHGAPNGIPIELRGIKEVPAGSRGLQRHSKEFERDCEVVLECFTKSTETRGFLGCFRDSGKSQGISVRIRNDTWRLRGF